MRVALSSLWVLCAAGACSVNPVTKQSEVALVSESREVELGFSVDNYLARANLVLADTTWQRYVRQVGLRLVAHCERPRLPWKFRVLDDTAMNAFAAPGGFVYVTRGMLVLLNSEAQLAAVLGHEMGHITARHAVGQATRGQLAGLGLAVATVATSWPMGYAGAGGMEALFLKHSRQDEQQADDLGLHYMSAAGYDPMEMLAVLRMLERSLAGVSPSGWLATHPSPVHRLENVALERFNLRSSGTLIERETYLRRLDGLVVGMHDGRPQHRRRVSSHAFVSPEGQYQFEFPDGWTVRNDSGTVRAKSPANDATIEIALVDAPNADSAARVFFARHAKARGPLTPARLNELPAVSAPFSLLPLSAKVRGYVSFIAYERAVYRVMGYAGEKQWDSYRGRVGGAMRSFEPIPPPADSAVQEPQSLRLAIMTLESPTSIAGLAKARRVPLEPAELALLNQVPVDSILPAGQLIKWVAAAPQPGP